MNTATLTDLFRAHEQLQNEIILSVHHLTDAQAAELLGTMVRAARIAVDARPVSPPPLPAYAQPVKLSKDETEGMDDMLSYGTDPAPNTTPPGGIQQ